MFLDTLKITYIKNVIKSIFSNLNTSEFIILSNNCYSLIDYMAEYKLYVNMEKSKASENLDLEKIAGILKETDYYLGIPFTRNYSLYGKLILTEFNNKIG